MPISRMLLILLFSSAHLFFSGPLLAGQEADRLVVTGSSTLVPMIREAGAAFFKAKGVPVIVNSGSSEDGYGCVKSRKCDVGLLGRSLTPEENKGVAAEHLGWDGFVLVANAQSGVKSLTTEQLRGIFSGTIKGWKEVGGADLPIVPMQRDTARAARKMFDDYLKVKSSAMELHANDEVLNRVRGTPGAIAYMSVGSALTNKSKDMVVVAIDGNEPRPEAIKKGTYQFRRELLVLRASDAPRKSAEDFINYLREQRGELLTKFGFIAN